MKKCLILILAAILVFSSCAALATESKGTLIMATNAAFAPYEYHEEVDGEDTILGIDAEIAQAICKYLGYDLIIDDIDFNAIIPAVTSGKADFGMAGMTVTDERLKYVNFSDTYADGIQVIIVKEGSDVVTSVDDLAKEGLVIGVQSATTGDIYATGDYGEEAEVPTATINRYNTGADAVAALLAGLVDCVIIDNEPAKSYVAANEGLAILDTEYTLEDYAIAISKENTELLDAINGALEALTEDGTIPAIIEKYIPSGEAEEEAEAAAE